MRHNTPAAALDYCAAYYPMQTDNSLSWHPFRGDVQGLLCGPNPRFFRYTANLRHNTPFRESRIRPNLGIQRRSCAKDTRGKSVIGPTESKRAELIQEIRNGTLGTGSIAFGEYIKNMEQAIILDDGIVCWIEICFCPTPLNEEKPYWEEYFENITIENAQNPKYCQDSNGDLKRACFECSCTEALEEKMLSWGKVFIS